MDKIGDEIQLGDKLTVKQAEQLSLNTKAQGFNNLLHIAIWDDNEDATLAILERLVPEGRRDLLFELQMEGASPLFLAVQKSLLRVVKKIISMLSKSEFESLLEKELIYGTNIVQTALQNLHDYGKPVDTMFYGKPLEEDLYQQFVERRKAFAAKADEIIMILFKKAGDELINKYNPVDYLQSLIDKDEDEDDKNLEGGSKGGLKGGLKGGSQEVINRDYENDSDNDIYYFLLMLLLII